IIDVDDDGQLGLEEAANWFSQLKNQTKDDTLGDIEFRLLFKEADENSDGFIQFEELDKALKLAFENGFESDESDDEDEHEDVEEREDSHVSELKPFSDVSAISKPTKLFEIIDSDNDGKITFVEASEWFSKMKNQSMDFTSDDKEFRNLFRATDKNSDGFIQPEELRYVEVLARALAANFLPNKSKQYFIFPDSC
uniref:EF-hand domain-containing protein n=1 Tax=Meloidogyne floridensis TaxID=298350 RepID=A0A915PAK6_9BILA